MVRSATAPVVLRTVPNHSRPRLHPDAETRLADIEQRSAASYAELEAVTESLKQLAVDLSSSAVPMDTDLWDDASMMHHVSKLQNHATEDEEE